MSQLYPTVDGVWTIQADDGTKTRFADEAAARAAYQQMEARRMSDLISGVRLTAPQEYEGQLRAALLNARSLILQVQGLSLLAQTNDITAVIAATPAGEYLAGTTLLKEDAELRVALFEELTQWLNQPLGGQEGAPLRIALVFRLLVNLPT